MLAEAVVLLALMCTAELFEEHQLPPQLNFKHQLVSVPADGRCFWSALFLAIRATPRELWGWYRRPRSSLGFTDGADAEHERRLVVDWVTRLPLPDEIHHRVIKAVSADWNDVDVWIAR